MSLQRLLQLIKQGDPVSPASVNRPVQEVQDNVQYLWELIQAAELGSTVYARQVTVEAACQVGMPVYLNAATQQFERALAAMDTDGSTGVLMTAPSSDVWGIVSYKQNATLADVLLFGYADLDISAAAVGNVLPGTYYLSGIEPGRLVRQRPAVSVPVLRAGTNGKVFVNPTFLDFLDNHRHFRFELACTPAGDTEVPEPGARHTITNPNPDWPGWLPADHTVFGGHAPEGAVFGYNLALQPALAAAWPPLPVQHVYMEQTKGQDWEQGYEGIHMGPGGLCVVDRYGIWWMSDCYRDVPWPWNLTTVEEFSESARPEHTPAECPREDFMSVALWFTKMNFMTDMTVVTSLTTKDNRLQIRCAGTQLTGSVGDLEIGLDLSLSVLNTDQPGYVVFKELSDGNRFRLGPVCEGLYSQDAKVTLTSPFQTRLVANNPASPLLYHGPVRIDVSDAPTRELQVQLTRMEGAIEEVYPVLYVGLPPDVKTDFIARFEVPADAPAGSTFAYRARILGRSAGNLPLLTVEKTIASRPQNGLTTPLSQDGSYTALPMATQAVLSAADQAVEAQSDPFTVAPGDLVFIRVTRDPSNTIDDDYPADVGFVQQVGILAIGS